MRKKYIVVILAVLAFTLIIFFKNPLVSSTNYTLEGKKYNLLIADNPKEWEQGLMNVKKLGGIDGMIFLFRDKKLRKFWNKNTYLDLEIIWMDDEKIVGKSFLPSITKSKKIVTVTSPQPVNKVVELIR